ncbi:MAG: MurT ligase domain-containing protein [Solirubrobacteraceae bacterium]
MTVLFGAKIQLARTAGVLARWTGRGGGTSLPGKLLLRLEPQAITKLAARLPNGCVAVSATNGKTTTATMTASILTLAGHELIHNRAGANMAGGIASTLLDAAGHGGHINGDMGLFELDEFWLDTVITQTQPRALLLTNLFRDQLDRYGELETIADRWDHVVRDLSPDCALVLNADDPLVADLGRERADTVYFGVQDSALSLGELPHASDSKHCRQCGAPYHYTDVYLGHLGHYCCESCGRERPSPAVSAQRITLHGTRATTFLLVTPVGVRSVYLHLPGLYNVYNAVAAAALCLTLGVDLDVVVAGLQATSAAFGRAETIQIPGVSLQMLLIKNPAGANEVLRTLALEPGQRDLLLVLNDRIADGRDVSWIWDADFEVLDDHVGWAVCSGTRAAEMAVRLKYAGITKDRIQVIPDLASALDSAASAASKSSTLHVLPTYTALLELQNLLEDRGHTRAYWESAA